MATCLWEGVLKEENFPHSRKLPHWWVQGKPRNLRGKHNKVKWGRFITEIMQNGNFQLRSGSPTCVHMQ